MLQKVGKSYGLVVIAATTIGLECWATGFAFAMPVRTRIFNKEFMQKHFGEIHRQEVGGEVSSLGYPDMGNGRYSEKLSYKDWLEFNSAQRAHYNFVEQVGIVIPMTLLAGLSAPYLASAAGFAYAIGRFMYSYGYINKGPKGRELGAVIANGSFLALSGLSFFTGYKFLRGAFL